MLGLSQPWSGVSRSGWLGPGRLPGPQQKAGAASHAASPGMICSAGGDEQSYTLGQGVSASNNDARAYCALSCYNVK
jgi:hypothetical protein